MKEFIVQSRFKIKNAFLETNSKVKEITERKLFNQMQSQVFEDRLNKLTQELQLKYKQQLQQEVRKSYQKGFQEGLLQTEKKLNSQVSHSINVLQTISKNLRQEIQNIIMHEEKDILELVLEISKKIIQTEISLNPDIVQNSLKNALQLIHEKHNIKVHVNKNDWNIVQQFIENHRLELDLAKDIEVVSSPSIQPGGCIIETESGTINADIDAQFNEIKRKLLADE